MSVPDPPTELPRAGPAAKEGLGGCLVALVTLIGIVLLLPGLCSLIFMIPFLLGEGSAGGFGMVWLMTFVIAAGGILLIGYAWRNR